MQGVSLSQPPSKGRKVGYKHLLVKSLFTIVFNNYFCFMARGKSKTAIQKQCPICSKTFIAKSSKGKYCGELCRQKRFQKDKSLRLESKIVDLSAQTFLQDKIINENVSVATTPTENVSGATTPTENVSGVKQFLYRPNDYHRFSAFIQEQHPEFVERLVNENINEVPELRTRMDQLVIFWNQVEQFQEEKENEKTELKNETP